MLIKLLPHNITNNWDVIKEAVLKSLPPVVGEGIDKTNRILEALLASTAECWVQTKDVEGVQRINGILVTQVTHDYVSDTKNLLIYCLYNYRPLMDSEWAAHYETLAKYAQSRGCARVVAYTAEPKLIDLVHKLGGEATYTFVSIPI